MMTFEKLFRLSGSAALGSGLLDFTGILLLFIALYVPPAGIGSLFFLVTADVLIVFALMGIYGSQVEESGYVGLAGFVLAGAGLLLAKMGYLPPSGAFLYFTGILILAFVSRKSKTVPARGLLLWFFGGVFALVTGLFGMKLAVYSGSLVSAFGRIWIGVRLRKFKSEK